MESKARATERFDAAAAWFVRLEENVTEDDWRAYSAWLEADPQNRDAFDAVLAVSDTIDREKAVLAADMLGGATRDTLMAFRPRVQSKAYVFGWAAGVAAVAAAIAVGVFVHPPRIDAPGSQAWSTGIGEYKDVKLADGSEIRLNTNTALSVTFVGSHRDVRLERGEASFDVVHDAARPFIVTVGDRRVEDIGTAFDILRDDGAVIVTVARGVVAVSAAGETAAAGRLEAGDQYVGHDGDRAYRIAKVDPAKVLAWRDGRLIFEDAPLADVVSDLNRYFERKLVLDETARDLRFSGILKIDNEPSIVRRLESFLPVVAQPQGNDVVLKRRPPA